MRAYHGRARPRPPRGDARGRRGGDARAQALERGGDRAARADGAPDRLAGEGRRMVRRGDRAAREERARPRPSATARSRSTTARRRRLTPARPHARGGRRRRGAR
jgi:hypothetical protein